MIKLFYWITVAVLAFCMGWICKPEKVHTVKTTAHDKIVEYRTKIDTMYHDSITVKVRTLLKQFCPDKPLVASDSILVNELAEVCDDTIHAFRDSLSFPGGYSIYDFELRGSLKRHDHFVVNDKPLKINSRGIYAGLSVFNFSPSLTGSLMTKKAMYSVSYDPISKQYGGSVQLRLLGW